MTSFKVPHKPIGRITPAPLHSASSFEVFVDEEFTKEGEKKKSTISSSSSSDVLLLNDGREINLTRETELLRQNPLRHFPPNSFMR